MAHFKSIREGVNSEENEGLVSGEAPVEEEKELRLIDKDLKFKVHILNRESARTEQLQHEQEGLESELRKVETKIRLRGVALARLEI